MALSWGMSYELYWHGEFRALRIYFKAYKHVTENQNMMARIQGIYNAFAIGSSFSKKVKFPDKPLEIFKKNASDKLEEIKKQDEGMFKMLDMMKAQAEVKRSVNGGSDST